MLKMALTEKGIISGSHYDITTASPTTGETPPTSHSVSANAAQDYTAQSNASEDSGGVFL